MCYSLFSVVILILLVHYVNMMILLFMDDTIKGIHDILFLFSEILSNKDVCANFSLAKLWPSFNQMLNVKDLP